MTKNRRLVASLVAVAASLAFFQWDRRLLALVPGWAELMSALHAIMPFLGNTLLVTIDMLFSLLCAAVVLRIGDQERSGPDMLRWLGLATSPLPALRVIGLAVLPAYLVFALTQPLNLDFARFSVLYLAFIGPFAEEVVFRGVAFGLLRRVAHWPFWAAAALPAVVFGLGHANPFHAAPSLKEIMTFVITATGAVLFSWLYERWRFDLWVPVLLHALMNFAWSLFRVGDGAFAGWLPLAMQVTTVALAILLTIRAAGAKTASERMRKAAP